MPHDSRVNNSGHPLWKAPSQSGISRFFFWEGPDNLSGGQQTTCSCSALHPTKGRGEGPDIGCYISKLPWRPCTAHQRCVSLHGICGGRHGTCGPQGGELCSPAAVPQPGVLYSSAPPPRQALSLAICEVRQLPNDGDGLCSKDSPIVAWAGLPGSAGLTNYSLN